MDRYEQIKDNRRNIMKVLIAIAVVGFVLHGIYFYFDNNIVYANCNDGTISDVNVGIIDYSYSNDVNSLEYVVDTYNAKDNNEELIINGSSQNETLNGFVNGYNKVESDNTYTLSLVATGDNPSGDIMANSINYLVENEVDVIMIPMSTTVYDSSVEEAITTASEQGIYIIVPYIDSEQNNYPEDYIAAIDVGLFKWDDYTNYDLMVPMSVQTSNEAVGYAAGITTACYKNENGNNQFDSTISMNEWVDNIRE